MNNSDSRYTAFGLVRDMLATVDVVANFSADQVKETARAIGQINRLLLTGEGSSRIFPARHAIMQARRFNWPLALHSESARAAQEFDLSNWAVFAASNSGKTSEVIKLLADLKSKSHKHLYGLTATSDSKLAELTAKTYVLRCGPESAVAATKSVIEMALFYHGLLEQCCGIPLLAKRCKKLAEQMSDAMTTPIDPALIDHVAGAGTIYFAGRNDGVAEELTLKANEITRKKSDYLEGTYAVHGIEEVMDSSDVVICLDPWDDAQQKFHDVLVGGANGGVGLTVIAIAPRPTIFPTIQIPEGDLQSYILMAGGWNLLVEAGLKLGVDLDKPVRARKVGNEFVG